MVPISTSYQRGKRETKLNGECFNLKQQKMCFSYLFTLPMIPLWLFWKLTLNILYNAYCFVHKHHERTFLRRKPCYRRRRKEEEANTKKNIQFNMKSGATPVFFSLLSPYFFFLFFFFLKLFVSVKSTFFSVEIIFVLLFLTVVLLELSWRHLVIIHTKRNKKKINFVVLFVLFFFTFLLALYSSPLCVMPFVSGALFFFF